MAIDFLAELTRQSQGFVLGQSVGSNPLIQVLTLTPPAALSSPLGLALQVVDEVVQPVQTLVRNLVVDLPLVGKWVRLLTPDLTTLDPMSEQSIGGMPVASQLQEVSGLLNGLTTNLTTSLPPSSLMNSVAGFADVPGVPSLLGGLKGVINETVSELQTVLKPLDPIPIQAYVRIRVVDDANPTSNVITAGIEISTGGVWDLLSNLPAAGLSLTNASPLQFSLRLMPLFSELRTALPDVVKLSVYVSIGLTITPPPVAGVTVPPITVNLDLPPLPLVLPTIPIPTLVVLCEDENFLGRKLVAVPSDSPLALALNAGGLPVSAALNLANQAIRAVQGVLSLTGGAVSFAGFLDQAPLGAAGLALPALAAANPVATAAAVVTNLAAAAGQIIFVASSQLPTLDAPNLVFDPGGWFGIGRATANRMASSLIVIGRPGTTVAFGQQGGWPAYEALTPLIVTLPDDQLICAISALGPPSQGVGVGVAYDPNDPASFTTTVLGGNITSFSPKQKEDEICSLAITRPPVAPIPAL